MRALFAGGGGRFGSFVLTGMPRWLGPGALGSLPVAAPPLVLHGDQWDGCRAEQSSVRDRSQPSSAADTITPQA